MAKHAILGASSASRWINCPGSVREIARLPKSDRNPTNEYADEGSAAHDLCEMCLLQEEDAEHFRGEWIQGELGSYEVNDEMIDAVQIYLDEIRRQIGDLGPLVQCHIEKKVYPVPGDKRMYGTADSIVVEVLIHDTLVVTDFKYGAGVVVEVEENDQAKFYALGSLRENPDVKYVEIVIVQPRAPHPDGDVRSQKMGADELREYAGTLIGAADRTEDPNAPLKAGDWCKFCPVAGRCPELDRMKDAAILEDFRDLLVLDELPAMEEAVALPEDGDLDTLMNAYALVPYLEFYVKSVLGMVARRIEDGLEFPPAKFIRGRANRKWGDDAIKKAQYFARRKGISTKLIWAERKLLSPAQLEKLKVKDHEGKPFEDFVAEVCEKPLGRVTLVPIADPREAIPQTTAEEDFADLITDKASV